MAGGRLLLQQRVAVIFVTGVLFGLYMVTACFANRYLLFSEEGWKRKKQVQWMMVAITNVAALIILAGAALNVWTCMTQSTFIEQGHTPGQWVAPAWDSIAECLLANINALLADIVLMYRLWVVYNKKIWVISFPIFLWIGGVVCTVLQTFLQVEQTHNPKFNPFHWDAVNMTVGPGIVLTPFWGSTIVLNAYCTGLLIWQISSVSKRSEDKSATRHLQFVIRILMESGVLYLSISLAHFLVWFGSSTYAIFILGTMNTHIIGIAFNLVLIRTAQNKMEDEEFKNELTEINFKSQPMIASRGGSSTDIHPSDYGETNGRMSSKLGGNSSKSFV